MRKPVCFIVAVSFFAIASFITGRLSAQQRQPSPPDPPDADGRVAIVEPHRNLLFRKEESIDLELHVAGLLQVEVTQARIMPGGGRDRALSDEVTKTPVKVRPDGTHYFTLRPQALGPLRIAVMGTYPDGGDIYEQLEVFVERGNEQPSELIVGQRISPESEAPIIRSYLHGSEPNMIFVNGIFSGSATSVAFIASSIKFSIRTANDAKIIRIDPATGIITPVTVGHALVESSVAGMSHLSCVVVEQNYDFGNMNHDDSHCEELLKPGEHLHFPVLFP